MPTEAQIISLHKKYAPSDDVFELVYTHCKIVYEIAKQIVDNRSLEVDEELLQASCLLHDIGAYVFIVEYGKTTSRRLYPLHSLIGAQIIREEGLDSRVAAAVRTHNQLGLSKQEIEQSIDKYILPAIDQLPASVEAELLCYADRFHSKKPVFNSVASLERYLAKQPIQFQRFQEYQKRFGVPDVTAFAERYQHSVT